MSATSSDDILCARITERLAKSVGPQRYNMWFDRSAKFGYKQQDRCLQVVVPNRFVADWINRHFDKDIRQAAHHELGQTVDLQVSVNPEPFRVGHARAEQPKRQSAHPRSVRQVPVQAQGSVQAALPLRHRLDDFVVGPSNELAHAAACRLIDEQHGQTHPLFIHGGCGLGKTHLLQGICNQLRKTQPHARVMYTTGEQFTNEFLTAMRTNKLDGFRRKVRNLDLLAVDDVHFIANKQATQQEFLHSFNAMELGGARVVLASDNHPKQIRQFSEALVSRCVRGLVVQIHPPDTVTRARMIRALAKRRGISLVDQVVDLLANRCTGSVREIEGALTKLQALAHLSQGKQNPAGPNAPANVIGEPIGHLLVERLFSDQIASQPRRVVRMDGILRVVAEQLGTTREQLLGSGRHRHVVLARSLAIYLARQMTAMSFPEIAGALGRGSHSTIVAAAQRIEKQLQQQQQVHLPGQTQPVALADLVHRLRAAVSTSS